MSVQPPVTVTVTYAFDPKTKQPVVTVTPAVVKVRPGQVIQFRRAGSLAGKMRLTFQDKGCFDSDNPEFARTGAFHEGDGDVRVKTMPGRTTYLCELVDATGKAIAKSGKDGGGAVEPVKTSPAG